MAEASLLLKNSMHRSVRFERRGESGVLVKRFAHEGRIGRVLDGRRALREFELLTQLSKAGVSVPRPFCIERRGNAHEVELEWIDGARALSDLCRDGAALSPELARRLGALLADLHSNHVDHPDLHPGNVLIAPGNRVVAIDFDKARVVKRIGVAQVERDLTSLCAGLRERTRARWRALALDAWWKALDPALRTRLTRLDGASVELRARERRREVVEKRARRWTRAGSAVEPLESGGFMRTGADRQIMARLLEGADAPDSYVRVSGSRMRVLGLWRSMARLEEHAIPAPGCRLLSISKLPRAWFELPSVRRSASPRGCGRLLAALLDRGLWCEGLESSDIDDTGLLRPRLVQHADRSRAAELLEPWLEKLAHEERQDFFRGVSEGWRGPARERESLLERIRHA